MVNAIPTTAGIYEIRNLVSGRCYIGSSRNLRDRQRQHSLELSKGRHCNPRLAAAYAKHGAAAFLFVVIEQVADEVFLRAREQFWLWRKRPEYNQSSDAVAPLVSPEKAAGLSATRSANARRLWADPTYREKAVAARAGRSTNKGYRCTPEQIENRRRAGRKSTGTRTPAAMAKRLATMAAKKALGWVRSDKGKPGSAAMVESSRKMLAARKAAGLPHWNAGSGRGRPRRV